MCWSHRIGLFAVLVFSVSALRAEETPLAEISDYAPAMRRVASTFQGQAGLVLHVGDALTLTNAYGHWARFGRGHSPEDDAALKWMHTDANDFSDGWWIARTAHAEGGNYTATKQVRADQLLRGIYRSYPKLSDMLTKLQPQIVVLLVGRDDLTLGRGYEVYRQDMETAVDTILAHNAICILTTLPPFAGNLELGQAYNRGLREIAVERNIPLIDLEREIIARRANDWHGALVHRNDYQLSAIQGEVTPASAPTSENLRESGYLLRGWLTVKKIAEVKRTVLDVTQ